MPRYFFDLCSGDGRVVTDGQGVDLPDLAAVRSEAEETARSFARDRTLGGYDYTGWHFHIRGDGSVLSSPLP
jgi:hypothetical protein